MNADEWRGRVGEVWAAEWARTDRSFAGLNAALLAAIEAAMPERAARLADIGCGAGDTSLAVAAARPAASIVGVDLSADLIAVAAARAEAAGLGGRCRFRDGDAATLVADEAPADGLFSRHGVMFFDDPASAFARLAAAVTPGAPLVFSCFAAAADNPWAAETVPGAPPTLAGTAPPPGPFAFADPVYVADILARSGWDVPAPPRGIDYRYVAGAGTDPVEDAVGFFGRIGPAARALAEAGDERPAVLARLRAACAARQSDGEVAFPATAWVWTARRR